MTSTDAILRLRELVPVRTVGMFSTITPGGAIHARPLTLQEIDDQGSLWFFVHTSADWVSGLQVGETVNFATSDDDDRTWVSVAGRARIVEDRARIDRLWSASDEHHSPDAISKDDSTLRLLELLPEEAEYWDAPSGALERLKTAVATAVGRDVDTSGQLDLV